MLRKLLGAQPITTPIDGRVLPLDESESLQFGKERCILRRTPRRKIQGTEPIGAARLLRARRERPRRCRPAEERDELAPPHSITSSARARRVGGTSTPSAFAALRLTTNSNLVDCMTGRSAGFSPLRIRPA